jgi:hypothetical protein
MALEEPHAEERNDGATHRVASRAREALRLPPDPKDRGSRDACRGDGHAWEDVKNEASAPKSLDRQPRSLILRHRPRQP